MFGPSSEPAGVYPELEKGYERLKRKVEDLKRAHIGNFFALINDIGNDLLAYKNATRDEFNRLDEIKKDLEKQFNELLDRVHAMKLSPHSAVSFVRYIRMQALYPTEDSPKVPIIEVYDGSGRLVRIPFIVDNFDVHTLKYGQQLLCPNSSGTASHVDEVLDEFKTMGVAATVADVLSADPRGIRYFVSTGEQQPMRVMHAVSIIDADALQKGTRILADMTADLIVAVLPPIDTSHKYLVAEVPDVTFADIGGLDALKRDIDEWLIEPILMPQLLKRLGEPLPKGGVLEGPPGVGKTMLAKAIVNRVHEIRCAQLGIDPTAMKPLFYSVDGPELLDKFVGESERKIRELFAEARRKAAEGFMVGLFIDEAESLLGIRGSGISSDVEKTIVPMFTSEMQGLEESGIGNIFIILASNLAHNIDSAVKRPGRCDQIFVVPRPDRAGSAQILSKYLLADWSQLHPKYNVDRFDVYEEDGRVRADARGRPVREQFAHDAKRVQEYLVRETVDYIFTRSSTHRVVRITWEGGKTQDIFYEDLVSGAILANIVKRAKRIARSRFSNSLKLLGMFERGEELSGAPAPDLIKQKIEPIGVTREDLIEAVRKVYGEIKFPPENIAARHFLVIENLARGREVIDISFTQDPNKAGMN